MHTQKNRRNALAFPFLFRVNRCLLFTYPNAILPELEKILLLPSSSSFFRHAVYLFPFSNLFAPLPFLQTCLRSNLQIFAVPLIFLPPLSQFQECREIATGQILATVEILRSRHLANPFLSPIFCELHEGGYKDFYGAPYGPQSTFTVANQCLITCECVALRKRVPNWSLFAFSFSTPIREQ